jgi:hypothetical protein
MAETKNTKDTTQQDTLVTVVQVPDEHAERVIEFARSLQEQDAEVTGYNFPGAVSVGGTSPIGGGIPGGISNLSGSNCVVTGPKLKPNDFDCGDSD